MSAPAGEPAMRGVVIGASAGAVETLLKILPHLRASSLLAVLIVVHLSRRKESLLPSIFEGRCQMGVKEAEDKEEIREGMIYFAPPDYHLLVNPDLTLALSTEEPVHFSRPSVDLLFESAAKAFGESLTGVILTGSNDDGAAGLAEIASAGGRTIVQVPDSAEASWMPRSALVSCPSALTLLPDQIAEFLNHQPNP
jgi:two-component system chemotaxis response regulator CheB